MKRKILVSSALPYANGSIHLGHLVEHIQTNIWMRFQKLKGHECYSVCADDTHGTPIMLAAEKKGITPEQMIDEVRKEHLSDFKDFFCQYDNYYTTHSEENKQLCYLFYAKLKDANKIFSKTIHQLYDPEKKIFLPDRYVKGECPKCHAKDQYGDNCEVCGSTYSTSELINPYSSISGAKPELRETEHYFFKLSDCQDFLVDWINGSEELLDGQKINHLQPEVINKMKEWIQEGLQDWDITRDAPYFGFEIPETVGKFFYVWLDAPLGYLASFKNFCDRNGINFDAYIEESSKTEMYHFIGKDILYFHTLFWPSILQYAGFRTPTAVFAHGFLTVNGQKMSKSRGTFITAKSYIEEGLNPEWLRYYFASKLSGKIEDIDLSLDDFIAKVNSDLVGKYINIAARASGFIQKRFSGYLAKVESSFLLLKLRKDSELISSLYEQREYASAIRKIMSLTDYVNAYVDENKPWELAKDENKTAQLHLISSELVNAFKILSIYLAPVLPQVFENVKKFLNINQLDWDDIHVDLEEIKINPYQHLISRIERSTLDKLIEKNKDSILMGAIPSLEEKSTPFEPLLDNCSIEDFSKLDIRVGEVLECEKVEGSTKLLRFILNLGFETRTVFSGIAKSYPQPENLVGQKVVVVVNFPARKLGKFGLSEGMILSADNGNGTFFLLDVDKNAIPGMKIG